MKSNLLIPDKLQPTRVGDTKLFIISDEELEMEKRKKRREKEMNDFLNSILNS